jgi:hypothetical protein
LAQQPAPTRRVVGAHERARLAATARHRPLDVEALEDARRALRAARAEGYIRELVAAAPPLSQSQRDRLALLLRGGAEE